MNFVINIQELSKSYYASETIYNILAPPLPLIVQTMQAWVQLEYNSSAKQMRVTVASLAANKPNTPLVFFT